MSGIQPARRSLVALITLAPFGLAHAAPAAASPGVSDSQIVLGHSGALTGPLSDLGTEVLKGAQLYFDTLNARGGVHGRKVKLIARDDGYDPQKTVANVSDYLRNDDVFALFGIFGTPNAEAAIPLAMKAGVPLVGPYSGAASVRAPELHGIFNIRASYAEETEKLVGHLATLQMKRLAIAHQDNSFGKEVLASALAAMDKRGMKPVAVVAVKNDASNAAEAADKLVAGGPEAVLLGLAGKPTVETIRNLNQRKRGITMLAPSVLAAPANLRALGKDGAGITVTQIVPFPNNGGIALVREYQQAAQAAGEKEFTHLALEGWLNAKVVAEALRRAGRNLTRSAFVAAMDGLKGFDAGGIELNFSQGASSGSRLVDLTMINAQGRLIR